MRIVIDTCIISELMRAAPAPAVSVWIDRFLPQTRLSAPVLMELETGLALYPNAEGRASARLKLSRLLDRFDASEFLLFDRSAAIAAAGTLAAARRDGRPLGVVDAEIIGIATSTNCAVATRDSDFAGRGVQIINPWTDQA